MTKRQRPGLRPRPQHSPVQRQPDPIPKPLSIYAQNTNAIREALTDITQRLDRIESKIGGSDDTPT